MCKHQTWTGGCCPAHIIIQACWRAGHFSPSKACARIEMQVSHDGPACRIRWASTCASACKCTSSKAAAQNNMQHHNRQCKQTHWLDQNRPDPTERYHTEIQTLSIMVGIDGHIHKQRHEATNTATQTDRQGGQKTSKHASGEQTHKQTDRQTTRHPSREAHMHTIEQFSTIRTASLS